MNQSQSLQLDFAVSGFQASAECRAAEGSTACDGNLILSGSVRGVTSNQRIEFVASGTVIGTIDPPTVVSPATVLGFSARIPNRTDGLSIVGVNPLMISVRQGSTTRGNISFIARCPSGTAVPTGGCPSSASSTQVSGFSFSFSSNTSNQCRGLASLSVGQVQSGRCVQVLFQNTSNSLLNEVSDVICSPRSAAFPYPAASSQNFAGIVRAIVREVDANTGLAIRNLQDASLQCPGSGTQSGGITPSASLQNVTAAATGSNCEVRGRVEIQPPPSGQTNLPVCAVLRVPGRAPQVIGAQNSSYGITTTTSVFEMGSVEIFASNSTACQTPVGSVLGVAAISCGVTSIQQSVGNPQVVNAAFQVQRIDASTCRVSGQAGFTGLNDPPGDIRIFGGSGAGYHCSGGNSGSVVFPPTDVPASSFPMNMRVEVWRRDNGVAVCGSPATRVGMPLRNEYLVCPGQGAAGSCQQTRCLTRQELATTQNPNPSTGYVGEYCGSSQAQCGTSGGPVLCPASSSGCCYRYTLGFNTCDVATPGPGVGNPVLIPGSNTVGAVAIPDQPGLCRLTGSFGYSGLNDPPGDVRLYVGNQLNSCGGGTSAIVNVNPAVFSRDPGANVRIEVHSRPPNAPPCTDQGNSLVTTLAGSEVITCPANTTASVTGITATPAQNMTGCSVAGVVGVDNVPMGMSVEVRKRVGTSTTRVTCLQATMSNLNGNQNFTSSMATNESATFLAQVMDHPSCDANPVGAAVQVAATCNAPSSSPQPSPGLVVDIVAAPVANGSCQLSANIGGFTSGDLRSVCMRGTTSAGTTLPAVGHGAGSNLPMNLTLAQGQSATFSVQEIFRPSATNYCTAGEGGQVFPAMGSRTVSCVPSTSIPTTSIASVLGVTPAVSGCLVSGTVTSSNVGANRTVCVGAGSNVVGVLGLNFVGLSVPDGTSTIQSRVHPGSNCIDNPPIPGSEDTREVSCFRPSSSVTVTPSIDTSGSGPCPVSIGVSGLSSAAPSTRSVCVTTTGAVGATGAFGNGTNPWPLQGGGQVSIPRGGTIMISAAERSGYCTGLTSNPSPVNVTPSSLTCPATGTGGSASVSFMGAPTATYINSMYRCSVSGSVTITNGPIPQGQIVCIDPDGSGDAGPVQADVNASGISAQYVGIADPGTYTPTAKIVPGTTCPGTLGAGTFAGPSYTCGTGGGSGSLPTVTYTSASTCAVGANQDRCGSYTLAWTISGLAPSQGSVAIRTGTGGEFSCYSNNGSYNQFAGIPGEATWITMPSGVTFSATFHAGVNNCSGSGSPIPGSNKTVTPQCVAGTTQTPPDLFCRSQSGGAPASASFGATPVEGSGSNCRVSGSITGSKPENAVFCAGAGNARAEATAGQFSDLPIPAGTSMIEPRVHGVPPGAQMPTCDGPVLARGTARQVTCPAASGGGGYTVDLTPIPQANGCKYNAQVSGVNPNAVCLTIMGEQSGFGDNGPGQLANGLVPFGQTPTVRAQKMTGFCSGTPLEQPRTLMNVLRCTEQPQ